MIFHHSVSQIAHIDYAKHNLEKAILGEKNSPILKIYKMRLLSQLLYGPTIWGCGNHQSLKLLRKKNCSVVVSCSTISALKLCGKIWLRQEFCPITRVSPCDVPDVMTSLQLDVIMSGTLFNVIPVEGWASLPDSWFTVCKRIRKPTKMRS